VLRGSEGKSTTSLKILQPLGAGGFGAVYEALDLRSGEHVAVKELDDTSADSIARFKHEFRALADCHHENLVGLRELIEQDGRWLIVMELVPGTDFLEYVRRAANDNVNQESALFFDEGRLRIALIGVVEGLRALHGFGVVHRDLKPSNVRVRPDGRAVLLDFGLATSVDPKKQSTHAMGVGTVVYMAPEQAGGESLGPAVDMYALGVCLFEALTGQAPFEGNHAIKIVLDKQRLPAPRAKSLVAHVPHELDELCARLLAIDPAARPLAEEVLGILTRSPVVPAVRASLVEQAEPTFSGRESELAHLERALALTHEGEQRLVLIEGESGVGKSELVSEFLRRATLTQSRFLALRGRCYENEQVSYKAFDGCIDELARYLRRLPESECAALLPERGGLLGQLFPALRTVTAIAKASREGSSADPTARRLEAFRALSQLLTKLSEERPLVLVLDDLQWADSESFRLLHALHVEQPPAPVLLLATHRPREELDAEVLARIEELRKWREMDTVTVFGLPREQAKALAKKLLGPEAPENLLELISRESQGHPLFMSELVQYTKSHEFTTRSSLTVDAALCARVDGLERKARELIELVALAARPYPSTVFAAALSTQVDETVRKLLVSKLLRQRRGHEIGCFHDRIRHATVGMIARTRLPVLHHQLASALEALPGVDASELAHHWDLAGKPERACAAYEQAALNALAALAFTRAAELFARAIALLDEPRNERFAALTRQRAESLVWSGRSAEAAALFQTAADASQGEHRIQLRSQAAMHMMVGAQIAPGIAAASQLLRELGFSIPRSRLGWIARFAWDALRLRFGRVATAETPHKVAEAERLAVTAARPILRALGVVHSRLYFGLLMQYARRAENLGLRPETAQVLAMRGWLRALRGSLAGALPLLEQARQLIEGHNDPHDIARYAYMAGSTHMVALDWAGSLPYLLRAERIAQEQCPEPWLLTIIRYHLGGAWYQGGQHAELARKLERWMSEARERNDVLGVALLVGMGHGFVIHLLRDDPEAAIDELERSVSQLPAEPYSFVHLGELIGGAVSRLYQGGSAALRFLDRHEKEHGESFLLRGKSVRERRLILRVPALLSAFAAAPSHERPALLEGAKKMLRDHRRSGSEVSRAFHALSSAQIEAIEGRVPSALAHARDALNRFRATAHGHTRLAEYLVGLLEGGAAGQKKCAAALSELRERGWRKPLRAIGLGLPLHALLSRNTASTPNARTTLLRERYEVTGQLGLGGFGSVVSARDVQTGRSIAIKELVRKGGMPLERFKQEFRALSDIHHENIVSLEALFEHEDAWYIVMERIDGGDLTAYVRASGASDAKRLKQAARELVQALGVLHQRGFVHRDVKPENVLVNAQGRAVLIDFGLVARIGDERDRGALGSVEYAAPEQLAGALPHPSADIYGLGATLYQMMSGVSPAAGQTLVERLQTKHRALPTLAGAPGLEELSLLVQLMLSPNVALRPQLDELARALEESQEGAHEKASSGMRVGLEELNPDGLFVGREQERAWLYARHERSRTGLSIALVEGESGLGKSALVSDFARRLRARRESVEVLRGRCYENEQVAFKAFDGVVDQLAQLMRQLPDSICEALLPRRATLLGQLFPVLSSVSAIADAAKKGLPAEPSARKQAGVACFVQLLANLANQRELLLVIDDLQWADDESFDMLETLVRHRETLPLTIVATVRPKAELEPRARDRLARLALSPCYEALSLEPLDTGTLSALARGLLDELSPESLGELVRESAGHPLFLRELIEHERSGARVKELTLDTALKHRIDGLPREARDVLALVALADKPHTVHVYAHALQRSELPREVLIALLGQGLLQRRGERLACYHDRIRRAAVVGLTQAERASAARRLAAALSQYGGGGAQADAAERARLWDEAGDSALAIAAYEQAGDQALEALSFTRAEEHYARALALLTDDVPSDTWQRLMVSRGHALVSAGRSAEAVRCFQHAAQHAEGESQVRLRIWAAQHLIQSAQVREGMTAARELLSELGIALPESEGAAKGRIAWERARVKLRGIALATKERSPREALALDALHGLSAPVRAVSFVPGSALVTQYLRRALAAGDSRHAARALAFEALWRCLRAPQAPQAALFDRSSALAAATGDPALIAEIDLTRGMAATAGGNLEASSTYLTRAHELLIAQCPGQPWLLTSVRMQLGAVWFYRYQFRQLRSMASWLDEARVRDDRYAIAALTGVGYASFRHALDDQPEAGLAELEAAMAPWPSEPFSTVQLGAFLAANRLQVLCADGPAFLRRLDTQHARLSRASLMRPPNMQYLWRISRFAALLHNIEAIGSAQPTDLIERARAEQRIIARLPGDYAAATARYFEAWLSLLSGDRDAALKQMREASVLNSKSPSNNLGIQYALGRLEGGDAGRKLCEEAVAQIQSEGWRSVRRGLASRLPVTLEVCDRLIGLP
jgi:serine/threonine protein kinase